MRSRTIIRMTFMAFLSGAPLFSQTQDRALPYYKAGNQLYSQKKYDDALKYYGAAVELDPNYWQAYQGEGNCYYAKGEKAQSISYYQKSLYLHKDNPGLKAFVDSLRAEVGKEEEKRQETPEDRNLTNYIRRSSGITDEGMELVTTLGTSLSGPRDQFSLGGGVACYYMFDLNFGLGGAARFYYFSVSTSQQYPYSSSSGYGTETDTTTDTLQCFGLYPSLKYKFDGTWLKPYVLGGPALAFLSAGESTSYSYDSGPPAYQPSPTSSNSGSGIFLGWEFGGGLEVSIDPKFKIVLESRVEGILSKYGSATFLPIELGANFAL